MALRGARAGGLSLWSSLPAITACPQQHNRHCKDPKRLPHRSAFAKRAAQRCKQAFQNLSPLPLSGPSWLRSMPTVLGRPRTSIGSGPPRKRRSRDDERPAWTISNRDQARYCSGRARDRPGSIGTSRSPWVEWSADHVKPPSPILPCGACSAEDSHVRAKTLRSVALALCGPRHMPWLPIRVVSAPQIPRATPIAAATTTEIRWSRSLPRRDRTQR